MAPISKSDRILERWEDLTTEWVTTSIAARHPDARVDRLHIIDRDDGTNRRLRLGLTYSCGTGPATLFLKANEPAHRAVHLRNGNLLNEAQLFAGETELPLDHPLVHEAVVDRDGANFLLVMEDIVARGADPRDATRPLSIDQASHGLRGLARLHSRYWGLSAATHPKLAWLQTWEPTEGWQVGLRKRVPIGIERAVDLLPRELQDAGADAIVDLWSRYVATLSRAPMTLLHGDAHIGNTYVLHDGTVGFLDWQVVRRGAWAQDVGYFLVGALVECDRRAAERRLVEEYRTSLDLTDSGRPSADQAWLHYRASPAYGLAIWLSTLGTDGWQSRAVSRALVQRYAAAFLELDTAAALAAIASSP